MAKAYQGLKPFKVIKISALEAKLLWGVAINDQCCDRCNMKSPEHGFYIAVLNRWYCKKCFRQWYDKATFYKEDERFEKMNFDDTVHKLKLLGLWEQ